MERILFRERPSFNKENNMENKGNNSAKNAGGATVVNL